MPHDTRKSMRSTSSLLNEKNLQCWTFETINIQIPLGHTCKSPLGSQLHVAKTNWQLTIGYTFWNWCMGIARQCAHARHWQASFWSLFLRVARVGSVILSTHRHLGTSCHHRNPDKNWKLTLTVLATFFFNCRAKQLVNFCRSQAGLRPDLQASLDNVWDIGLEVLIGTGMHCRQQCAGKCFRNGEWAHLLIAFRVAHQMLGHKHVKNAARECPNVCEERQCAFCAGFSLCQGDRKVWIFRSKDKLVWYPKCRCWEIGRNWKVE